MVFLCIATLALLSFTDIRYRLIPKGLNFLALIWLAIYILWNHTPYGLTNLFIIYLTYSLLLRFSRGSIGYGDVRLAPLAMDYGSLEIVSTHLYSWVFAGAYALISLNWKGSVPFAPFLFTSTLIINHL